MAEFNLPVARESNSEMKPLEVETSQCITQQPSRHENPEPLNTIQTTAIKCAPPVAIPYGLEYLNSMDLLFVSQKRECFEIFTGFETENKYAILNKSGQKVYYARENSDCCGRNLCGNLRPFNMDIVDNQNREVLRFDRPLSCAACCCPCCLQSLAVLSPSSGELYGSVRQVWTMLTPLFIILNANGDTVLRIKGPILHCGAANFRIFTPDGQLEIGKIKKQWTGLLQELFSDADNFAISFPLDLDVRIKAVLLGALFLIDYMYFEKNGNAFM